MLYLQQKEGLASIHHLYEEFYGKVFGIAHNHLKKGIYQRKLQRILSFRMLNLLFANN
jgi:hypothetical protein